MSQHSELRKHDFSVCSPPMPPENPNMLSALKGRVYQNLCVVVVGVRPGDAGILIHSGRGGPTYPPSWFRISATKEDAVRTEGMKTHMHQPGQDELASQVWLQNSHTQPFSEKKNPVPLEHRGPESHNGHSFTRPKALVSEISSSFVEES